MSVELRKRKFLRVVERSLPDENLRLVGFGCDVPNCEWSLSTEDVPFHKALRQFGFHNIKNHEGSIAVHMTQLYEVKNGIAPKPPKPPRRRK